MQMTKPGASYRALCAPGPGCVPMPSQVCQVHAPRPLGPVALPAAFRHGWHATCWYLYNKFRKLCRQGHRSHVRLTVSKYKYYCPGDLP